MFSTEIMGGAIKVAGLRRYPTTEIRMVERECIYAHSRDVSAKLTIYGCPEIMAIELS